MISSSFTIHGMSCRSCVKKIESAVLEVEGVEQAKVDFQNKQLNVVFDNNRIAVKTIKEVVESKGFDVAKKDRKGDDF